LEAGVQRARNELQHASHGVGTRSLKLDGRLKEKGPVGSFFAGASLFPATSGLLGSWAAGQPPRAQQLPVVVLPLQRESPHSQGPMCAISSLTGDLQDPVCILGCAVAVPGLPGLPVSRSLEAYVVG
jgi:hypothetical protein